MKSIGHAVWLVGSLKNVGSLNSMLGSLALLLAEVPIQRIKKGAACLAYPFFVILSQRKSDFDTIH